MRLYEFRHIQAKVYTMAAGWSTQETKMLVSIWGEADVQSQLDGVIRNKVIYEKISRKMEVAGFFQSDFR